MSKAVADLSIGILATYRLTKLIIDDELLAELRQAAYSRLEKMDDSTLKNKLIYLLGCPWCISIWAAASLLILHKTSPSLYNFYAATLGLSAASGLIYERLG